MFRHRLGVVALIATTSSCGLFSSSPCSEICDYYVECSLEQFEDQDGSECEWDNDDKEFRDACMSSCKEEYAKLDRDDAEEVTDCVTCVLDDVDGDCDLDEYTSSLEDCEDECEDGDVEDFFDDFWNELDWEDQVDCEGATVTGTTTETYY